MSIGSMAYVLYLLMIFIFGIITGTMNISMQDWQWWALIVIIIIVQCLGYIRGATRK